ncbi:hypothetical protein LS73_002990 [Helicobacter muridarum]|uniref:Uncharacterized protein n=1 Tax=Helicobacter muridarum TaxID=216 RepID=A0A377PVI2_9HELI|nr:hypothetical protein [Helicobacter muridarum]TLE00882.1 hypothetical protein LS73_002990 [Helicobacter muridarum]STQ86655.1 Uncharacterised protein [Helicobacter muridarum]
MEFQTRLVESRLQIEFQLLDEDLNPKALEEYHTITQIHNNSIEKWLSSLKSKSGDCKCGGGTFILGEMLVQIYKKLEHIENLISGNAIKYIDLEHISHTYKLGHGIVVLQSSDIGAQEKGNLPDVLVNSNLSVYSHSTNATNISNQPQESHGKNLLVWRQYYVRLFLPTFPARYVPLFAEGLDIDVFRITKIGERDLKDYDGYIMSVEREMLKARKSDIY